MNRYVALVEDVARAVRITSPTSFTWFGAPSPRLPAPLRRAIDPGVARSHLLFLLRSHLYNNVYRVGEARPTPPEVGEASVPSQETDLAGQLSRANRGQGSWEPGWVVRQRDDGLVALRRAGLEVWVTPADCLTSSSVPLGPGTAVALRLPKESFGASPGYYIATSDEPLNWDRAATLVRLYWNVAPEYAERLVRLVTERLNRARVPFRLKVLNNALAYTRFDTAVLYILKRDLLTQAAGHLAAIHADCRAGLRPGSPAFTKRIAPGLGLAEDPGSGVSFGQHRCEALAEGLVRAAERDEIKLDARVRFIGEAFAEAGIDIARPYQAAGTPDDYDLGAFDSVGARRAVDPAAGEAAWRGTYLGVAVEIGRRLAAEAIWHQDRCTWLGLLPHAYAPGRVGFSYGALGCDLYDGTAGTALFLAELHCLTGDEACRRTALGAMRQALRVAEDRGAAPSIGLYTGTLGVAFAAVCLGVLLAEGSTLARARGLLRAIEDDPAAVHGFDLLSGRAGAVAALLVLHEVLHEEHVLDFAVRLGRDLLASAERTARGWSWRADDGSRHRNLTGLSHGAAGAGHALLELFDLTRESRYREGAEEAFRYERSWFSSAAGNWPDFRDEPGRRRPARASATYRTQWCHGAAGIALTRVRAFEILGEARYRDEAAVALATTERDSADAIRRESLSFCLCHGLAGNADVILEGRELLQRSGPPDGELPERIGGLGAAKYAAGRRPWPCGIPIPGRETPGLMLGLAGIGHFYLRLQFPTLALPFLLLRRQRFRDRLRAMAALQGPVPAPRGAEP